MTKTKTLGAGEYLHLVANDHWEWAQRPAQHDAACIIATDQDGALILVEQYRHPLASNAIELPAGLVGDEAGLENEALLDAAARELEEETGYESDQWTFLMRAASSAGLTSEMPAFVRAQQCKKVSSGGGVGDENIRTHVIPLDTAEDWLETMSTQGFVMDVKVYVGLAFARAQLTPILNRR